MKTIKEIRYENFLLLIEEAGSIANLFNKTGISPSYLLQIKNKTAIQNGKPKGIGDKIARKLETGMGKPSGWLDQKIEDKYNLADNVRFILRQRGQSEEELAQFLKMDLKSFQNALEETLNPHSPFVLALSKEFFVSPVSLLHNVIATNRKGINLLKSNTVPVIQVPIRGHAQLGDNAYWDESESVWGNGTISWPSRDSEAYALACRGDSMEPRIKHGEYVIIEPNHRIANGDEVLVVTKDGRVMVKIYAFEKSDRVTLLSINQQHEPINLDRSQIHRIHYVAGIVKNSLVNN